jgi:hypothetical protein
LKTTAERVEFMMKTLILKEQTEFGLLCGASRSTVNQWLSGRIKNIDPRYAFKLEENSPLMPNGSFSVKVKSKNN